LVAQLTNFEISTNNNIINSIETKQDTIKDDIAKQTTDMLKLTDQEKEQIVNLELLTSLKEGVDEGLKNSLAIRLKNPQVTKEASYISKIKKNITEAKGLSPKPAMKAVAGQINKNFVANFV
jgi:hypothetical protein